MPGVRRRMRGSVAVEFALILPFLCLLVIGGWVLGYMAYTKMALAMVANRVARDLAAATQEHGSLRASNQAYRYDGGFGESFGLPRWGIRALAMKAPLGTGRKSSDQAVVVAVCYRVPFTVPFGLTERPSDSGPHLPDTSVGESAVREAAELARLLGQDELERLLDEASSDYQRHKRELEEEIAAWDRLLQEARTAYQQGREIWSKGGWAAGLLRELVAGPPPDLTPYHGDGAQEPDGLERAVRSLCEPPEPLRGRSVVMTARSAYLLQSAFEPKGGKGR